MSLFTNVRSTTGLPKAVVPIPVRPATQRSATISDSQAATAVSDEIPPVAVTVPIPAPVAAPVAAPAAVTAAPIEAPAPVAPVAVEPPASAPASIETTAAVTTPPAEALAPIATPDAVVETPVEALAPVEAHTPTVSPIIGRILDGITAATAVGAPAAPVPSATIVSAATVASVSDADSIRSPNFLTSRGLNWEVRKCELITTGRVLADHWKETSVVTAPTLMIPDDVAIVRSDNHAILGIVGDRFHPLQNDAFFGLIAASALGDAGKVISAGPLMEGALVHADIEVAQGKVRLSNGTPLQLVLRAVNGHAGNQQAEIVPLIRMQSGGLAPLLRADGGMAKAWRVRHSSGAGKAISHLSETLGKSLDLLNSSLVAYEALAGAKVSYNTMRILMVAAMHQATEGSLEVKDKAALRVENAVMGHLQAADGGSLLDLADALVRYADQERRIRGVSDPVQAEEQRRATGIRGTGQKIKSAILQSVADILRDRKSIVST